jgi:glutamate synthase domain-containing protein 3
MMAEPQFVSDGTLLMIKNAADYVSDAEHGGEVVITGQSQGSCSSRSWNVGKGS